MGFMKDNALISCEGVFKTYCCAKERLDIIKGASFELKRGQICFILGRSGSGKSTLLHILGGLDKPDSGRVFIEDIDLYSLNESKIAYIRNSKVGFVFQFYHLIPELTVFENVVLPGLIARKKLDSRACELLEVVGLQDRMKHLPRQLSGGEMQRVALARALINKPDIVFCDEPTGNLDDRNAEMIYGFINKLNREIGQSFCIVTHEEGFVSDCDGVYRLSGGVLVKQN